jgi:hypothetical protein
MADSCDHGNENLGSIKNGEFLDEHSDYWLLKKVPTVCRLSDTALRINSVFRSNL